MRSMWTMPARFASLAVTLGWRGLEQAQAAPSASSGCVVPWRQAGSARAFGACVPWAVGASMNAVDRPVHPPASPRLTCGERDALPVVRPAFAASAFAAPALAAPALAALAFAALLLAPRAHADTLAVCTEGSPDFLNAALSTVNTSFDVTEQTSDHLVGMEVGGSKLIPALAEPFHAFAGGPFHADHLSPVFAGVQAAGR